MVEGDSQKGEGGGDGDSQKGEGGGDGDDVRNEMELRNGLDGKGQAWGLWRYIGCEK